MNASVLQTPFILTCNRHSHTDASSYSEMPSYIGLHDLTGKELSASGFHFPNTLKIQS